ncbi:hypothetical protein GCM10010321_39260 [Streptomyces chartreusis]|nr:hypothetical protein GCM10010321_39260 [Streptomyces chartreusis]
MKARYAPGLHCVYVRANPIRAGREVVTTGQGTLIDPQWGRDTQLSPLLAGLTDL